MSTPKGMPPLVQEDISIGAKGRVTIALNPTARLNAQHERLTGAPAPGSSSRTYRPHDHCQDGGAVLCRGTLFSLDVGGIGNGSYFRHTIAVDNTWESMIGTSTSRDYIFRAFPTPGLGGTLAAVFVARSYGDAIQIRITNLTTGTSSTHDTTNAGTPAYQGTISDIPYLPGQENRFDIEIQGLAAEQLDLLGLCVYEDTTMHPSSNGTTTYSSL